MNSSLVLCFGFLLFLSHFVDSCAPSKGRVDRSTPAPTHDSPASPPSLPTTTPSHTTTTTPTTTSTTTTPPTTTTTEPPACQRCKDSDLKLIQMTNQANPILFSSIVDGCSAYIIQCPASNPNPNRLTVLSVRFSGVGVFSVNKKETLMVTVVCKDAKWQYNGMDVNEYTCQQAA